MTGPHAALSCCQAPHLLASWSYCLVLLVTYELRSLALMKG